VAHSSEFVCSIPAMHGLMSLSSAEPYEFLVKLRNITWETNYVIFSQNALGMMSTIRLTPPSRTTKSPLLSLHYPYNPI
jgi:hypothetical protein